MSKYTCPVGHTCPSINSVQGTVSNAESSMKDALSYINDIQKELEDLRSENSTLRSWGEEMAELAEMYEDERDEAVYQLEELKKSHEEDQSTTPDGASE